MKIQQLDIDGQVIQDFHSISEAATALHISTQEISKCLSYPLKSYKNWKFRERPSNFTGFDTEKIEAAFKRNFLIKEKKVRS